MKLNRDIFLRRRREFGLTSRELLQLLKPLYGLSDSRDYCYETFKFHIKRYLNMNTVEDLSLWFSAIDKALDGLVGRQVLFL